MTDRVVVESADARHGEGGVRQRYELAPRTVWATCAVITAVLAWYFWNKEGWIANIAFAAGITVAIAATLVLLTRRILFATILTASIVAMVVAGSTVKQKIMNMVVHAYDLFFYFSSWSTVSFLWNDHRTYMLALIGAVTTSLAAAAIGYRLDGTRVPRSLSAVVLALAVGVAVWGAGAKGERRHTLFYWEDLFLSSFYSSWSETIETLWRGQLVEAAPVAEGPLLKLPAGCEAQAKPPHIVLIHQESVIPPSVFPQIKYDRGLDPLFKSQDGKLHSMRVETYGGASWLTEFSILAGVSTNSFGGMRQFVQSVMEGKLKDTLPHTLERCGYRNVVFYPMLRNFVSNARFYQSIGLKEIYDQKSQGAPSNQERDRFYYDNALADMERHFKSSGAPLFTFVQTMSAHWPYDFEFMPEVKVPGGAPGTHPELSEYLRRLAMSKMDYTYLVSELKRRFPKEQFLIVHYGDHHPTATRGLLGFKDNMDAEDIFLDPNSRGFITYYAVQGLNYTPPPVPDLDVLDVPYLGMVILEQAGIPLSDANKERKRLMGVCKGRYYTCEHKDEILAFHRRLIDSGLMEAR